MPIDEQAAAAIAGYTVVNDLSVRDFQNHTTQFMPGKAWERSDAGRAVPRHGRAGSTPAEFPISCEVDGSVMQSSNTE